MNRFEAEDMLREKLGIGPFFNPKSGRVYKAEGVVLVNDGPHRALVVKLADGRVVTSNRRCDNTWGWLSRQFWGKTHRKALVKLGVLTDEDVAAFEKATEEHEKREERRYAAIGMKDGLETAGLKPTKAQQRFIDANL